MNNLFIAWLLLFSNTVSTPPQKVMPLLTTKLLNILIHFALMSSLRLSISRWEVLIMSGSKTTHTASSNWFRLKDGYKFTDQKSAKLALQKLYIVLVVWQGTPSILHWTWAMTKHVTSNLEGVSTHLLSKLVEEWEHLLPIRNHDTQDHELGWIFSCEGAFDINYWFTKVPVILRVQNGRKYFKWTQDSWSTSALSCIFPASWPAWTW